MTLNEQLEQLGRDFGMGAGAPTPPKVVLDEALVRKAKEQRFGLSAKILGGSKVKRVHVINNAALQANADYNTGTKVLRLNEAYPLKIRDEVEELIFDRAKLYHEIGHALYTAHETKRKEYGEKSKNPDAFLTVSGLLEDGRIERKMIERYQGTQPYFDALLDVSTDKKSMDVLNGLALRVRKGFWRNEEETAFWAPFEKQIDKAIKAKHTNGVLQTAFDIVEAMPDQPPQPKPKQPEEEKEKKPTEEKEPTDSEPLPPPPVPPVVENSVGQTIDAIVEQAIKQLRIEAEKEWNGILEEVQSDPIQEMYPMETTAKDQLVPLFRNVLTESARTKEYGSREGLLNSLGLHHILTSKRVFKTRTEGKGKPHVALLLDASGSMAEQARTLGQSARILNGALQEAGIKTKIIVFGMDGDYEVSSYATVPLEGFGSHGGTPTGAALQAANAWFEEESATRPLAIIVTDGGPSDTALLLTEKQKTNDMNGYVLGVNLEDNETFNVLKRSYPDQIELRDQMYNAHDSLSDAKLLPDLLEPLISQYINS